MSERAFSEWLPEASRGLGVSCCQALLLERVRSRALEVPVDAVVDVDLIGELLGRVADCVESG